MDQRHKDLIRANYVELVDDLKTSVEDICTNLYQAHIISATMRKDILENMTSTQRAEALLDLIPKRGQQAFHALYLSCLQAELIKAADILNPIKAPHLNLASIERLSVSNALPGDGDKSKAQVLESNSESSSLISVPESWPSKELTRLEDIRVTNVLPDSQMYKVYFESLKPLGQRHYYVMQHEIRGRVVVLNNETFIQNAATEDGSELEYLSYRQGSSRDRDSLEILFTQLGYQVIIHNNRSVEEMKSIFEKESLLDHSNYDCIIVIVLSHGEKGKVFGNDGYTVKKEKQTEPRNFVQVKYIKEKLCNIRSLIGKPKLLFIQACRGNREDPGVEVIAAGGATAQSLEIDDRVMDLNLQEAKDALSDFEDKDEADGPTKIPSDADYFVAMSTTSGYVSWRNPNFGTWFIQALVYIFWKHSHEHDLHKLITMANNLVCTAETAKTRRKQVAEKKDTLRKTFYFFPGLLPNMNPPPLN